MYSVEFKNITAESLDLTTLSLGRRQRAQEQINTESIPYSDTEYIEHTGKYIPYERTMEFYVADDNQIDLINSWLVGYGKLRTAKDIGGYFKAHVISDLGYEKMLQVKDKMTVTFKVNPPFMYLDSGDTPITLTAPGTVNNPGTYQSESLIRIVGNGNITVSINGRLMFFTNMESFVDIDPEITPSIFKNNINVGEKMVGDLPYLDPGLNQITWTGNVTEINIVPRWRSL